MKKKSKEKKRNHNQMVNCAHEDKSEFDYLW